MTAAVLINLTVHLGCAVALPLVLGGIWRDLLGAFDDAFPAA